MNYPPQPAKFCCVRRDVPLSLTAAGMPRGRPPPGPARTNICQDSRSTLARLLSDYPPDEQGFGAVVEPVNRHDDELSSIFRGRPCVPSVASGGLTQAEAELRAVKRAVKRGPEQAVNEVVSMLARTVTGIAGIEAGISQATAAARQARGMPERAAAPATSPQLDDEHDLLASPTARHASPPPRAARVKPWTDAATASADALAGTRLQRLLVARDREQVAAGPRRQGAASDALWPVISPAEIVGLMRGVRFFRDAELPPEAFTEVAGWFELTLTLTVTVTVTLTLTLTLTLARWPAGSS